MFNVDCYKSVNISPSITRRLLHPFTLFSCVGMMNKKKDSRSLIDIRPAISTITSCVDAFDVIVSNASLDNAMPAVSLDNSCLLSCEASIAAAELDDVADYMEVLRDIELPEVFHGEGDFQERKEAFLSHGDEQSQCRNLIDWILRD